MSTKYKFANPDGIYFITFATVGWIDVFTRTLYKNILLDTFSYCIKEKGLIIYAYVIMTNHVHLIISRKGDQTLSEIIRDLKKYSSVKIIKQIIANPEESRKKWLLYLFDKAGKANSNNINYQLWQQDNHPQEIDHHIVPFDQKLDYIHQNPVRAGLVYEASTYIYSSAGNYEGLDAIFKDVEVVY